MTVEQAIHELTIDRNVIEDMISYSQEFEPKSDISSLENRKQSIDLAIRALRLQVPAQVAYADWNPCRCPACGNELSESIGDGYYKHHTHLGRCPNAECGQRLRW